jgi:hypothetical protein
MLPTTPIESTFTRLLGETLLIADRSMAAMPRPTALVDWMNRRLEIESRMMCSGVPEGGE